MLVVLVDQSMLTRFCLLAGQSMLTCCCLSVMLVGQSMPTRCCLLVMLVGQSMLTHFCLLVGAHSKLQALVYDTAIVDYAIGLVKLSANEVFR